MRDNEENIPEKYAHLIEMMKRGDYSRFEELPSYLRNYYGALEVRKFVDKFKNPANPEEPPSLQKEDVREYLQENAMNAVFRAGISAGLQDNKLKMRWAASHTLKRRKIANGSIIERDTKEKRTDTNKTGRIRRFI